MGGRGEVMVVVEVDSSCDLPVIRKYKLRTKSRVFCVAVDPLDFSVGSCLWSNRRQLSCLPPPVPPSCPIFCMLTGAGVCSNQHYKYARMASRPSTISRRLCSIPRKRCELRGSCGGLSRFVGSKRGKVGCSKRVGLRLFRYMGYHLGEGGRILRFSFIKVRRC